MGGQSAQGDQNVQIHNIIGSSIEVTFGGRRRDVPLEPAVVPPGKRVRSPARLLRARSGVVPYSARAGLLTELQAWLRLPDTFAGCVIGGRGGTGKTRLGVELCEQASSVGWLSGLLSRSADLAALEALVEVPTPRLIVVDYAESRAEQLELVLPSLAVRATPENPVRVVMLVRSGPRRTGDWTEALRRRGDMLDAILDDVDVHVLEEQPLGATEREDLFCAAAQAFANRVSPEVLPVRDAPSALSAPMFASPLLVVIAAYLALHGERAELPATRSELLQELVLHEDRYWSGTAEELDTDVVLRQRVVTLATLAGADDEAEAVELLRLVPDLRDASLERLGRLARWAHDLYPGPRWWNPLEPDVVAEHLVATCYSSHPSVLRGVLSRSRQASVVQPLDTYARAGRDYPQLAAALAPVLSGELRRLCSLAVEEARSETDVTLLLNGTTAAGALQRAVMVVAVDPEVLPEVVSLLPTRRDLAVGPLAITLTEQLVALYRQLATTNPAVYEPELARSLNNLSPRLMDAGRRDEGLEVIEEAVAVNRRLATANPAVYEPELARSLNNLSASLTEAGRREEGLAAIEEAVAVLRQLFTAYPAAAYEPELAGCLNNQALLLTEMGRHNEALAAIEKAVAVCRQLAAANQAVYEPQLATSLNTLSHCLPQVGRRDEGLAAIEEAVAVFRRLAAANPAAYEPDFAKSLNNLSLRLAQESRPDEALAPIEQAAATYRQLAAANPAAYEPDLAKSLNTLSNRLTEEGRHDESLAAIEQAVAISRRVAAANPAAYEPDLATFLNNLSLRLRSAGRSDEALAAIEEAVAVSRRLATANPAAYQHHLARSLNNQAPVLMTAGRSDEAVAAIGEAVAISRRLAAANPAAYEPVLATSLKNLSLTLAHQEKARRARSEALRWNRPTEGG